MDRIGNAMVCKSYRARSHVAAEEIDRASRRSATCDARLHVGQWAELTDVWQYLSELRSVIGD